MSKYILYIEEERESDDERQSTGKVNVYRSFKSAYRAFRRLIVEKIKVGVPYFPVIVDGRRQNTTHFFAFEDMDEEYTEEDKLNADKTVDILYKTVLDENYVFFDSFDLQYRDSEIYCICSKNSVRLSACGFDTYDIVSNAHLPPNKDKQYYFFYEWCDDYEEWRTCSFAIRLMKQT